MNLYYMSFADDHQNLGVCFVEAESLSAAVAKTHLLGINPGGEIMFMDVTRFHEDTALHYPLDKLLSIDDLTEIDGEAPISVSNMGREEQGLLERQGRPGLVPEEDNYA